MKKPWSITTTLREPGRLRDFLIVLKNIEGQEWTKENQKNYQILLIKNRIYGYGSTQFYNGLPKKFVDLMDDLNKEITFDEAKEIFRLKDYEDPAMRGRQSINPLKKLGVVSIKNNKIFITDLGKLLLKDDYDLGEMFFRSFIKWQIPNLDNRDYAFEKCYNIKPFIGTLHLINSVNEKTKKSGGEPKGISKQEFSLFCPTLVDYKDIDNYADKVINLRAKLKGRSKSEQKDIFDNYRKEFAQEFLEIKDNKEINKLLKNLKDYGDNAIRYFRLTRYIYIRGGGFYIDLEPRRKIEISNLLAFDNGSSLEFESKESYLNYISNITEPKLPWETEEKFVEIIEEIVKDIRNYENKLSVSEKKIADCKGLSLFEFKKFAEELREYRRSLQEQENHVISQDVSVVENYIEVLSNIYSEKDRPLALEKYSALSLHALNDAIKIQPNYPVGDDNEPTFTAPAGKPDIECYYNAFNAICEVTMLTGRDQWYNEGQPIMRHLRDFEEKNNDKDTYCIFVAPTLHRDTLNTFWFSVKYEYEGKKQKIIPLSIKDFIELLKTLIAVKQKNRFLPHSELANLYNNILLFSNEAKDVNEWVEKIPSVIFAWQKSLIS